MKILNIANWVFVAIYIAFCIFSFFEMNQSGMDKAGKGMASAFTIIFLLYAIVIGLLNLIQLKWVKIIVFILALLPLYFFFSGLV